MVALGALGIAAGRRKKVAPKADDELGVITGQLTSPVIPSPDTGDFTTPAVHEEDEAHQPDDVDPISEADLFLNFGRDEQAEEVLKDALQHSPDNHQLHLKLLGIYANRQDAAAFGNIAQMLKESGDVEAIQQAEILGQKLLKAEPQQEARLEDTDSATRLTQALSEMPALEAETEHEAADEGEEPGTIDFDVTQPAHEEESEFEMPEPAATTDFDVTQPIQKEAPDFDVTQPIQKEAPDFDVTQPIQKEAPDFDVTQPIQKEAPGSEVSAIQQGGMDLDVTSDEHHMLSELLDFDIYGKQPEPQKEEALPVLDDLIFDLPTAPAEKAAAEPSSKEAEEEFMLDFPVEEEPAKTPHAIDLSDISLDLNEPGEAVETAEGEHGERWHEVATKLDLAKAYQEMGDEIGAREILDEVMQEGDTAQQQEARMLIGQLG